ncbi:MAG: sensor domain-containing diguanylate cyclase [Roseobacter sp.]
MSPEPLCICGHFNAWTVNQLHELADELCTPDLFQVGCVISDDSGRIRFANAYMHSEMGFEKSPIVGKHMLDIFTHASRLLIESYIYPTIEQEGKSEDTLLTVFSPDNRRLPVVVNARPHPLDSSLMCWTMFRMEQSHPLSDAILRSREVLEDKTKHLSKLAATDELTGLFNRREFLRLAHLTFENAALNGTPVSIMMADIDHFKRINDTYGHETGDDVLQQLGKHLRAACRTGELVARYGGEEFIFCAEGISPSATKEFARRMHAAAALVQSPAETFTLSIGIGLHFGGTRKSLLDTMRCADDALYGAKEAGRNRTFLADGPKLTQCN